MLILALNPKRDQPSVPTKDRGVAATYTTLVRAHPRGYKGALPLIKADGSARNCATFVSGRVPFNCATFVSHATCQHVNLDTMSDVYGKRR